jgi:hypothetical protein
MTFFRRRRIGSLALALALLLHTSQRPLSAQIKATTSATWLYDLVPLDLPDVRSTSLAGINNQNDVVGSTFDGLMVRPFLVSGGVLSVPELPGGVFPSDINDHGQIVGRLYPSYPNTFPGSYGFVYSSGTWQVPGPHPIIATSAAGGINNYGHVVGSAQGTCQFTCGEVFAYLHDINESGYVTESGFTYAGINDAGDIVGTGPNGAFWRSAGVDTLIDAIPNDINNVNTIVGHYVEADGKGNQVTRGFVLSNGRYVSIDVPGASETQVEGVNDSGVIVGSYVVGREGHGFVGIPRSPVDVTINGENGPVTIAPAEPLQVQLQFTAPPDGPLNPAEVYIGVVSPVGLFWFDPVTGTFVQTPTSAFVGALPSFGPASLLDLPNAAALPSGNWWWFMIVDDDSNGTVDGPFFDVAQMIVP